MSICKVVDSCLSVPVSVPVSVSDNSFSFSSVLSSSDTLRRLLSCQMNILINSDVDVFIEKIQNNIYHNDEVVQ